MPAERAGYTVTMFLVDISPSMGKLRNVELPGEDQVIEMTNLEWSLQFVKLKIQEMIYNGRKTDQCGVILFGTEDTDNIINTKHGGYDHVSEYIPIGQPNAETLANLDILKPSTVIGDPIDALIVGIETQAVYLANKKTWTRKIIITTDGENPIEIEDWEATVKKMDALDIRLIIVGVDFDDEELPYHEEGKSEIKRTNENFFATLTDVLPFGVLGTCALALRETNKPDIKQTKSTLMGTVLRLGDVEGRPDEALEILIKTSKCTAVSRPKAWKKFALREADDEMEVDGADGKMTYAQLRMRSEFCIDRSEDRDHVEEDAEEEVYDEGKEDKTKEEHLEKVEKEQLVKGFKYGSTYVPCPDGSFPRLDTKKGIDICGFFQAKNFRREHSLGEIQYVWADPTQPQQQVALSSIAQAMYEKNVMAIARWVTKDGMDPKMGVLAPSVFEKVDCLLWAQMPFADDVRKYTFASLDNLVSRKGEAITDHPYIPTTDQLEAMDKFVDAMDLMDAGEKDEDGNRLPWFDTRLSYNPAVHRTKQAQFHCAIVSDLLTYPLPSPHPELLKYLEPPKRLVKRANDEIEECKKAFKVKEVPKKVVKLRKDGHVHATGEDEDILLLDRKKPSHIASQSVNKDGKSKVKLVESGSETEEEEELLLDKKTNLDGNRPQNLPTPARSLSPDIDPRRAPGRIIGSTFPLKDFRDNIAQGDIVSKAVEDLGIVIREIVMKPFSSRRTDELLECMTVFRDVSLKEDEIDAWNQFLLNLRQECTSRPGNKEFWGEVLKQGTSLSLISNDEAVRSGGTSSVSETAVKEFLAGH